MKKINRKGFTLIELLAVIVVLAIILVITIPTVLGSLGGARQDAFNASANSAADWFEKQYGYCTINGTGITDDVPYDDANYPNDSGECTVTDHVVTANELKAAGLDASNYDTTGASTLTVNSSGRACLVLKASSTGDFANVDDDTAESSGC